MLLSGVPVTKVAAELHPTASLSSLSRHRRSHVGNILSQTRLTEETGTSDLLARLVETLEDVSAARHAALIKGSPTLLLRSADSTLRVITTLLDRVGFDALDTITAMNEGAVLARAVSKATKRNPEIGAAIVEELKALEGPQAEDVATELRALTIAAATTPRTATTPVTGKGKAS